MGKSKTGNNSSRKMVTHVSTQIAKKIMNLAFDKGITRDQAIAQIIGYYFKHNEINLNGTELALPGGKDNVR